MDIKEVHYRASLNAIDQIACATSHNQATHPTFNGLHFFVHANGDEINIAIERMISLIVIDDHWKDHLRNMDDLKQSVQNATYEQKDPLLIYKFEAFNMFKKMLSELNKEIVSFLFKGYVPLKTADDVRTAAPQKRTDMSNLKETRDDGGAAPGSRGPAQPERKAVEPIRVEKKVGRNDTCPCGSGKKYKNRA